MKKTHNLIEQTFNQGDYVPGVETAIKPTTVGRTLEIELPSRRNYPAKSREEGEADSKALARWNPGFNRAIAKACAEQIFAKPYATKQLSWQQPVVCGHTPFRRDCRVYQESSAKARPHRSVPHPLCGVLSVDVTGPLCRSKVGDDVMRYILVGAFTWIKPTSVATPAEPAVPEAEEEAIVLEDREDDPAAEAYAAEVEEDEKAKPEEADAVEIKEGFEIIAYRLVLRQLQKEHSTVEIVPSKMVLTLKPGPRRRARVVGCGNFYQKQEGQCRRR